MSRDQIIGRVREALSVKTDSHVREVVQKAPHSLPVLPNGPDGKSTAVRQFLPFVGESFDDHKNAFATLSEKLQTEFICVERPAAAEQELKRLVEQYGWKRAGVHELPLVQQLTQNLELEFLNTSQSYDVRDLEQCDVGISGCDALIAQTASALVTNQSAGGRALSVLPPHHVVLATADQMVTTMADGFEVVRSKYGDHMPSFVSFISGPSRTADIERVLVLGAHGPKKLTVILIEAQD
jgi:L-lactate dehydrogenase complex protein LldG